jgi:hypothetical protein
MAGGKNLPRNKQLMAEKNKEVPFHSDRFNTDVTDQIIKVLEEKDTVCTKEATLISDGKELVSSVGCALSAHQNLILLLHLVL